MKKETDILTKLSICEDITPGSVSDFITTATGFTVSSLKVVRCGRLIQGTFSIARSSQWAAGSAVNVGTVKSEFIPATNQMISSASFSGVIASATGAVYLRPTFTIAANAAETITFLWLTA